MYRGLLYCLSNPSYRPGLVKIGLTTKTVEERMRQLSQLTGVPTPFHCEMFRELDDVRRAERVVHTVLGEYRVNPRREFFLVKDLELVRVCFDTVEYYGGRV